jgi:hypothetical protein
MLTHQLNMSLTVVRVVMHLRALIALVVTRVLLQRAGLEPTIRRLDGMWWIRQPAQPPQRVARSVQRVARWLVPGSACLAQSVAVTALLRGRPTEPEIILGCHRINGEWVAHAWVEYGALRLEPVFGGGFDVELARCRGANGWHSEATSSGESADHSPGGKMITDSTSGFGSAVASL